MCLRWHAPTALAPTAAHRGDRSTGALGGATRSVSEPGVVVRFRGAWSSARPRRRCQDDSPPQGLSGYRAGQELSVRDAEYLALANWVADDDALTAEAELEADWRRTVTLARWARLRKVATPNAA